MFVGGVNTSLSQPKKKIRLAIKDVKNKLTFFIIFIFKIRLFYDYKDRKNISITVVKIKKNRLLFFIVYRI